MVMVVKMMMMMMMMMWMIMIAFLHTCYVEVYPQKCVCFEVEVHFLEFGTFLFCVCFATFLFPGLCAIDYEHHSDSCFLLPLPEVSPVLTTFAIVPILWAWGLDLQQTNPWLLKLAMLGAIVANHEGGRAYVRVIAAMMIVIVFIPRATLFSAVISETGSSKLRRCQLCGTSRHQLPGFPARAGYRSRSGHTAVRELVEWIGR